MESFPEALNKSFIFKKTKLTHINRNGVSWLQGKPMRSPRELVRALKNPRELERALNNPKELERALKNPK